MPLIESEPRGKKSTLSVELDGETRTLLNQYCRYSRNTGSKGRNRVIRGALHLLAKQDNEFPQWCKDHPEGDDADEKRSRPGKKKGQAGVTTPDEVPA